ncbi:hypothetical protein NIES2119_05725 [[Phormidium ambiguum] IAM M-71]|uniref:DUF4159 domain-containing protein n=1 Tax=[Phormidium ambiguum] IAM M-71 TaxID=454136 RepID=A0A1U7IQX4_9CYAN|nr:DUF4159 domain-containing protein [Phormidium ambiguum]OKH39745.1 hypothetical protein NIES2119_05725 [Phormidium ambiguum IAM M-71]
MSAIFPLPEPSPLTRLSVEDGLLLNAELWQCAHQYHRHRQNIHFQSLNQPGIVSGLGVSVIPAPENIAAKYRDGRWLEISHGVAIDLLGNPIVVPQPIEFRLASEAKDRPLLVYITVSYVDPEKLYRQQTKYLLEESFRIDEKTSPPTELEVELCRILILPGTVNLTVATNVFFPQENEIDLRYRKSAMARRQEVVRTGLVTQNSASDGLVMSALSELLRSITALYPAMEGIAEVSQVSLLAESPLNDDLIYINYQEFITLSDAKLEVLRDWEQSGVTLLIELPGFADSQALINLKQMVGKIVNVSVTEATGEIHLQHPLRKQPFLFGEFPVIQGQEISILNWGGIVVIFGNISQAWGLDTGLKLPRETIRIAQEMGINILHFAYRRRQLAQLQKSRY